MTRTGSMLLACMLAASAGAQQPADEFERQAESCRALPSAAQGDCLQRVAAAARGQDADALREDELRRATRSYHLRLADLLARSGRSRELAFAATLRSLASTDPQAGPAPDGSTASQPLPQDQQAFAWRGSAAARAGKDVVANALLLTADSSAANSEIRAGAVARWLAAEPDNMAPLLSAAMPIEQLLQSARDRSRFDTHAYDEVRWITGAFAAHPPTASEARLLYGGPGMTLEGYAANAGMGIWATKSLAFQTIVVACRDAALSATPTRRRDCRHVAEVLSDASDTLLGRAVGLVLLVNTANDAAERSAAVERRRRHDWQMLQWSQVTRRQPNNGVDEFARLLRDPGIGDEIALMDRVLQEAGIATDPPAGWIPPRAN